ALEVEELQRRLQLNIRDNKWDTVHQETELTERRAKILRGVARVRGLQQVYMPIVFESLEYAAISSSNPQPENIPLLLPSSIDKPLRPLPVLKKWVDMEVGFRRGQLVSSLDTVRQHLFVRTRLHSQRSIHVRHQKASTKARQVLDRNERKLKEARDKYRAAWKALEGLVGKEAIPYPQLEPQHLTSFNDADNQPLRKARNKWKRTDEQPALLQPGETRKVISWIWTGVDCSQDSPAMRDALRVEWCKAQ
ncbi:hypothetical protein V5O48_019408, partial [Marasmius crinis-equi]